MKHEIITFDTLDSTSTYIKENYRNLNHYVVVRAFHQSKGRGRLGRSWKDSKGSLMFSILIKDELDETKLNLFPLLTGLSVHLALKANGVNTSIKWPNDIMLNSKKVSGMIVESICEEKVEAVISGIGINVNNRFFVDEIKDKATSLKLEIFKEYDEDKLLNDFLEVFFKEYEKFKNGDYSFLDIVRDNFYLLDKEVYLNYYNEDIKGIVKGIDDRGMIIIESNSKLLHLNSGEVTLTHNYSNLNQ